MGDFIRKLSVELKKYEEVLIYGYADIGKALLEYIIDLETDIKIANYSGKVKYFAGTEVSGNSNREEIRGIKVRSIKELVEYADNALVIIATQEHHHADISKCLDKYGFKNRLFVMHEDAVEIRVTLENHKSINTALLQQYHINHNILLDRIRRKAVVGKKIKVFFMCHEAAAFGVASVYENMIKSELFDPYVFVVSRRDVGYKLFYEDVLKDVDFFERRGYRVICGYDENKNPKDLHFLQPDIIFYDLPKMHGEAGNYYYRLDHLNWEYLTIYVPYGLMMVDSFYYHYHTQCIRESWRFFVDTTSNYKRVLADGSFNGFNVVNVGYPKFDDYYNSDIKIPNKIDNGNPIVIYAPHHSLMVSNNFATFDLYYKIIMDFVKKHPKINFVYKPHPLLEFQIAARYREGKIKISSEEYKSYVEEWNNLENGIVITAGDYIPLFIKSSCMITDCGSFIGEYLPAQHPCIYLFNPRKKRQYDSYTITGKKILDTYYIIRTEEELHKNLKDIIENGNDEKAKNRAKVLNEEFGEIGDTGKRIVDYIKSEIVDY